MCSVFLHRYVIRKSLRVLTLTPVDRQRPAWSLRPGGSGKVTACGFVRIITTWSVQYKRPLYVRVSQREERGMSPAVGPSVWAETEPWLGWNCLTCVWFCVCSRLRWLTDPSVTVWDQRLPHRPRRSLSVFPFRPFVLPLAAVFSFFSTHHLPRVCSLFAPPPTPPHPQSVPSICSCLPSPTISCPLRPLSLSSFSSSAHLLPRGNLLFLACSVYLSCPRICH